MGLNAARLSLKDPLETTELALRGPARGRAHWCKRGKGVDAMRGFIGLCLLITGLAIGAHSHYPGPAHREASLAELTQIVTGAIPTKPSLPDLSRQANAAERPDSTAQRADLAKSIQRRGWFANSQALTAHLKAAERKRLAKAEAARQLAAQRAARAIPTKPVLVQKPTRVAALKAPPKPVPAVKPTVAVKPAQQALITGWKTAVVRVDAAQAKSGNRITSLKPRTNSERWKLVKTLQSELKRVGCYWGKVDGIWGKGSKYAMSDFMRNVNAALPTRDPDYILLQLVASHTTKICGRDRGTIVATNTRPNEQQYRERKWESASPTYRIVAAARPDVRPAGVRRAPLPGRMTIGALNRDAQPQLVAPPADVTRYRRAATPRDLRPAPTRLQISALNETGSVSGSDVQNGTQQDSRHATRDDGAAAAPQADPFVAAERSAAKARRAKALRKASKRAKTRKRRYRRYNRRRSIQTFFMHPLGRR